jgi:shikimate kinase
MGARAVFLVGFMGSGKTSVGCELAQRLGWEFVDLDAHIEAREGQGIPQIFRDRGEAGFRAAETAALMDLTQSLEHASVVALGGGAFVQDANRELLRAWPSVFLQAPVDELWRRCSEDEEIRPLRKDSDQFAQLHAERLPFYRQATVTVVTSGRDPASICAEIEAALQLS